MRLHDDRPAGSVAAIVNGKDGAAPRRLEESETRSRFPIRFPAACSALSPSLSSPSLSTRFSSRLNYSKLVTFKRLLATGYPPIPTLSRSTVQLNVQLTGFRRVLTDVPSRSGCDVNRVVNAAIKRSTTSICRAEIGKNAIRQDSLARSNAAASLQRISTRIFHHRGQQAACFSRVR